MAVKSMTIYIGVKQSMMATIQDGESPNFRTVFIRSNAPTAPNRTLNTLIPWNPNCAKGELSMVYRGLPQELRNFSGCWKEYLERK